MIRILDIFVFNFRKFYMQLLIEFMKIWKSKTLNVQTFDRKLVLFTYFSVLILVIMGFQNCSRQQNGNLVLTSAGCSNKILFTSLPVTGDHRVNPNAKQEILFHGECEKFVKAVNLYKPDGKSILEQIPCVNNIAHKTIPLGDDLFVSQSRNTLNLFTSFILEPSQNDTRVSSSLCNEANEKFPVEIDTSGPLISINSIVGVFNDQAGLNTITIGGSCSENGQDVQVIITHTQLDTSQSPQLNLSNLCKDSIYSVKFSSGQFTDSSIYTIVVTQSDSVNNQSRIQKIYSPFCSNGAINPPSCNTCQLGYSIEGTSCKIDPCANGATNAPQCTVCAVGFNYNSTMKTCEVDHCNNGATNVPDCNICQSGYSYNSLNKSCDLVSCANGAINAPDCTLCTSGYSYNIASNTCLADICGNGAVNPPSCNTCQLGYFLNTTNSCILNPCTNGATNPPSCTTCSVNSTYSTTSHSCLADCAVATTVGSYFVKGNGETIDVYQYNRATDYRTVAITPDGNTQTVRQADYPDCESQKGQVTCNNGILSGATTKKFRYCLDYCKNYYFPSGTNAYFGANMCANSSGGWSDGYYINSVSPQGGVFVKLHGFITSTEAAALNSSDCSSANYSGYCVSAPTTLGVWQRAENRMARICPSGASNTYQTNGVHALSGCPFSVGEGPL